MNWHHFNTFVWLRYRLFVNQLKRGGIVSTVILVLLAGWGVVGAIGLFIGLFAAGYFLPQDLPPIFLLMIWDGVIFFFLLAWAIGLMAELQRSEALSLDRLLHLPVSLSGAFALNYLSSLVCLTILLFVPQVAGLSLGLLFSRGPALIVALPLTAAFVFMVTALSYQFQGWLATLMVNKRRRRTIIVFVTLFFIMIFQLPNLINIFRPWQDLDATGREQLNKEIAEFDADLQEKKITQQEHQKKVQEARQKREEQSKATLMRLEDAGWIANMVLPIGWLPLGVASASEGNFLPALLGFLGMTLIGGASIWRAYRTMLRLYTGQFTSGKKPTPEAQDSPAPTPQFTGIPATNLVEKPIPGLSDEAAAIALAGFRSLLRAPEVKMLLLSPVIMLIIFGGLFFRHGSDNIPAEAHTFIIYGSMAMILFTMGQLAGNQFGYDRSGFRIFVLSPAPRREILLGKNLALLPLVAGLCLPIVVLAAILLRMRIDHALALPFQFTSMFLIYCLLANVLSIVAPMPVAAGSLKAGNPRFIRVLQQMLFVLIVPNALAPTFIPLGLETLLEALDVSFGLPICLVLTVLECVAIVALYRRLIGWEGNLLQSRELNILDTVIAKAE